MTAVPIGSPLRTRARSAWVWVVLLVMLTGVVGYLSIPRSPASPFDPTSAEPAGTKALAQVLRSKGVRVDIVRDQDAVGQVAASADAAQTTLVVTAGALLDQYPQLLSRDSFTGFGNTVILGVGSYGLSQLGLPVRVSHLPHAQEAPKGCTDTDLGQAQAISSQAFGYLPTSAATGDWTGCFGTEDGYQVVSRATTHRIDLVSSTEVFRNDTIERNDNAALALRLLGRQPRVLWYAPKPPASAGGGVDSESFWTAGLARVLPPWTAPALDMALMASLFAMFWRGRRLGRLVTEPLPVEVPALETTLNRARLYERTRDRSHALSLLQRATRRRLIARLGLPASATPVELAEAAARATGRDPRYLHQLLTDPSAADDRSLVAVATELAALDQAPKGTAS